MALLIPDVGKAKQQENYLNKTAPQDHVLKLYKNNITPAAGDVAGTYTEADFTGYAAVTLGGAGWTVTPGDPSLAAFAQQTFLSSADQAVQQIYGYFLVGAVDGVIRWVERFPAGPYPVSNLNDAIKVTPKITQDG